MFADTQDEPDWVYQHVRVLREWATKHGMEIAETTAGRLSDETLGRTGRKRRAALPAYTRGVDGRSAMLPRQCTEEYKLAPIRRYLRKRLGVAPRAKLPEASVTALIGISFDERVRIKDSRRRWIVNRWPLIDAVLRGNDCDRIAVEHGLPVASKSACIYCPFHDDRYWVELQRREPHNFAKACDFDDAIRAEKHRGLRHQVFIHRSLIPLRDVSFDAVTRQPNFFNNECSGSCGV